MDFGDAIGEISRRSGMTLREISAGAGRSPDYIAALRGRGTSPSVAVAAALAAPAGYVVALVPAGDVPAGALVIDPAPPRG